MPFPRMKLGLLTQYVTDPQYHPRSHVLSHPMVYYNT